MRRGARVAGASWRTGLVLALGGCTTGPVVPKVGAWVYRDDGLVETTCADDLYRDPDATFAVIGIRPGGFTASDGEAFECTLDGRRFSCPDRRKIDVPITGDTVLTWTVAVDGVFRSASDMHGEQTFTIACTGSLCGLDQAVLGYDLPCAYTVAFHATAGP